MSIFKQHRRTERVDGSRGMIGKRLLLHGLVAVTAVAGVAALAAATAVPALADSPVDTGPTLTLSNSSFAPGQWSATGSGYAAGLSDVQIFVEHVTGVKSLGLTPEYPTLESQSGLTTSARSLIPYNPGGLFSASGETRREYVESQFGGAWGWTVVAMNPLQCGQQYWAFTSDPTDGVVPSNLLTEPACP